ncbi:hypothetical protein [Nitrospira sp. Nam74]
MDLEHPLMKIHRYADVVRENEGQLAGLMDHKHGLRGCSLSFNPIPLSSFLE